MNESLIHTIGAPCFYLADRDNRELDTWMLGHILDHPNLAARTIRGKKSKTASLFFNEASAALQFPFYFGENWNAFNDCITDFQWLPAARYLLVITDAPLLLSEADEEDWRILIRQLAHANEYWVHPSLYDPSHPPPKPFHVLFQCPSKNELDALANRLTQMRYAFAML